MKARSTPVLSMFPLAALVLFGVGAMLATGALLEQPPSTRAAATKLMQDGNFKDAYEAFRKLTLDPAAPPAEVGDNLRDATQCLQNLGRTKEIDAYCEQVIAVHAKNWRLLSAAADNYLNMQHFGFMIAGQFERGQHRGGGQVVDATSRDRIRALQLMVQAMPLVDAEPDKTAAADFYLAFSRALLSNRGYQDAWRLQYLSDLTVLPDYDPGWNYGGGQTSGAPVDAEGQPIYYTVPASFEKATNDGERWRWALSHAAKLQPAKLNETRWELANFCQNQFGVQTIAQFGLFIGRSPQEGDGDKDESGTFALHTLKEDETIARLAVGVRRFKLPDEFNYIKIYEQIAADPQTGHGAESLDALAREFENRRQYPRAAEFWRAAIAAYGKGDNSYRELQLQQIVGNWGRFDGVSTQPAGQGPTVDFRFRNGKKVNFDAQPIKIDKLLTDVKAYLKSNPAQLDWNKINIADIGYRLVEQDQKQYVGASVATWELELDPREAHFDKRITVTTPLMKAGAYLVTATLADGNTSKIVLWVADTAIIKKPLIGKTFYYVADAVNGAPIEKANLELFGYRQRHLGGNRFQVDVLDSSVATDSSGQAIISAAEKNNEYQWLAIATTRGGRLAFLGFTHVWGGQQHDAQYNATKVFAITDRPVYRPDQGVHYKLWIRNAQYDQDGSDFGGKSFKLLVMNPRGEKVVEKQVTADQFGGIEGEYKLPADAMLGVYQVLLENHGGGNFRVEEYKKPEYEVTVEAPKKPVMLGEKIQAKITAKYYFGSPVTEAKVHYKVTRSAYDQPWFPVGVWDWFYGPGYWWFAYDCTWYPGWKDWGCPRPMPLWWPRQHNPPEIVADVTVPIGADGTVTVDIDTTLAKEIHGNQDHKYEITAEVVDQSRRTIVGQGNVLVARKPFKVFAWVDRGFYRVGDTVKASFNARTLDGEPVEGKGKLTLFEVAYDDKGEASETKIRDWDVDTTAAGVAQQQLEASAAGQYRLSYTLTDAAGHAIEGGYLFTVRGAGFTGADFRFNHLELITDAREYQPGGKVKLMVNTDRVNSTVLLFPRPSNGVYLPPKVIRLNGKSTVEEFDVTKKDMPNFFVEAVTIAGGQLYTEAKEIVVPPESRVLNVEVQPSETEFKPGQEAEVKVKLTDFLGKPFVGTTVMTVYDKSVDYIAGGSNVPNIKEFFWKWRRYHNPHTETSLQWNGHNLVKSGKTWMNDLGIFGGTVADELSKDNVEMQLGAGGAANAQYGLRASGRALGGQFDSAKRGEMREGAPTPMAMAVADAATPMEAAAEGAPGGGGMGGGEVVQPTIRSNFADTAFWAGSLVTDASGMASVRFKMPENLTGWKMKVWGLGQGTRVGQGEVDVVTRKNLIVRMQAPRFFVEKDEVVLSANVHNYLKTSKNVEVSLEFDGSILRPLDDVKRTIEIPAGGEKRVDWRVAVASEGNAVVIMKALTDEESDAVQNSFPAYIHGMLKMESFAGAIRPQEDSGKFKLRVPSERKADQSRLEIAYSPTLAGAMVDALPYMAEYPYGCTEQTLNRFLPTVITQKVLLGMKLNLAAIRDKRSQLNSQELGDPKKRAEGWKRFEHNAVFDEAEVTKMAAAGVKALTEMQLSDGGWGWFSGWGEHSTAHTTATVVHGLQVAKQNDTAVDANVLARGLDWLKRYQEEQVKMLVNADGKKDPYKLHPDNTDALVYMVLVESDIDNAQMQGFLYKDRNELSVYGKTLLGIALQKVKQAEKLAMVLRNIEQYLVQDDENQTAYLKLPEGNYWWFWYGSDVEAMAYYLKLLVRNDPKSEVAPRLAKYLLNNRKHATYWNSTRDTALCIESLAEFIKASGEDSPELTVEVWIDGKKHKEVSIDSKNLFMYDDRLVLTGDAVEAGEHTIEIKKRGRGPIYYNAYLTNFTLEDPITAAGLEVKVNRNYYKLLPVDKQIKAAGSRGQAVDQKVEKYERQPLADLASLKSGELVEIELVIESKNDYEYLLFEDMKAAGFEPVEVRSGYTSNALNAYVEFRDNRVAFFARTIARGKHSVSYRLRAEIPGKFSALPAKASAMYAPELKGNSNEFKVIVVD